MLLNKEKTNLVIKVVAIFMAVAFIATVIPLALLPSDQNKSQSKLDPEREEYYQSNINRVESSIKNNPKELTLLIEAGNLNFDYAVELRSAKDTNKAASSFQQAIDYYQKALEIDPKNGDVRTDLGIALHNTGKGSEAIEEFKKAIEVKPDHSLAYFNWGVVASQLGRKDEAIQAWEKFLELEPTGERADFVKKQLEELKKS